MIVRTTRADRLAPKIAFVLAQLGPWPTPSPLRRAWDRARPPLRPSDFPCGNEATARRSLARAHSWLERGMLTRDEFDSVEKRCAEAIQRWRT